MKNFVSVNEFGVISFGLSKLGFRFRGLLGLFFLHSHGFNSGFNEVYVFEGISQRRF